MQTTYRIICPKSRIICPKAVFLNVEPMFYSQIDKHNDKSMTGFSKAEISENGVTVSVEIKKCERTLSRNDREVQNSQS